MTFLARLNVAYIDWLLLAGFVIWLFPASVINWTSHHPDVGFQFIKFVGGLFMFVLSLLHVKKRAWIKVPLVGSLIFMLYTAAGEWYLLTEESIDLIYTLIRSFVVPPFILLPLVITLFPNFIKKETTMSQPTQWQVQHASVVLLAESPIEPMSIAAVRLASKSIIPQDWTIVSNIATPISTPVFAETVFTNGTKIRTEGNRCIFQQNINGEFPNDYVVHELAAKYAAATELAVRYQAIGINWQLAAPLTRQSQQLLETFLNKNRELADFKPETIRLTKPLKGKTCNLNITAGQDALSVEINYHYQVADSPAGEVLTNWRECQQHLQEEIIKIVLPQSEV